MKEVYLNWVDFKYQISIRDGFIQEIGTPKFYDLYLLDDFLLFHCSLPKNDTAFSADIADYEANYKASSNHPIEVRSDHGIISSSTSVRPKDTSTYFCGAGVNGQKIQFDMLAADNDTSKSVLIDFSSSYYVKDAVIAANNAPLGSVLSACVEHIASGANVKQFAKDIPLLSAHRFDLNSDDRTEVITPDFGIRIKVTHSPTKVDFQSVGFVEVFI